VRDPLSPKHDDRRELRAARLRLLSYKSALLTTKDLSAENEARQKIVVGMLDAGQEVSAECIDVISEARIFTKDDLRCLLTKFLIEVILREGTNAGAPRKE
jgi:hypothetical protein